MPTRFMNRGDDKSADHRSDRIVAPTETRGAADYDGGDRVQFIPLADQRATLK